MCKAAQPFNSVVLPDPRPDGEGDAPDHKTNTIAAKPEQA